MSGVAPGCVFGTEMLPGRTSSLNNEPSRCPVPDAFDSALAGDQEMVIFGLRSVTVMSTVWATVAMPSVTQKITS